MGKLSDVFKYISHFRHAGHQVGRKVGDMLEVLTFGSLYQNDELRKRLQVEPKLYGFSDAGHKVEFVLHNDPINALKGRLKSGGSITDPKLISAFIECKKVGVEQTISGSFKKNFNHLGNKRYLIPAGQILAINFAPRGRLKQMFTVQISANGQSTVSLNGQTLFQEALNDDIQRRYVFAMCENGEAHFFNNEQSLRDLKVGLDYARVLELYGKNDGGIIAILNDCLAGPQTPEKAKQASFVALDVRKARFGSFDKRPDETELQSVLVLTEFSHWEKKSRNMITACIDVNLAVPDHVIVAAFEEFERIFGQDFYDYVTKEAFSANQDVQDISANISRDFRKVLFTDISDGKSKFPDFYNGKLKFVEQ